MGLIGIAIAGIAIGVVTLFVVALNSISAGRSEYLLAYGGGVSAVVGTAALAFVSMAV